MSDILTADGLVLHIWPGQWGLPSFDPFCLAAVLYLQLAIPGKFSITETSNPDTSPTGQLPFLVHEQYTVASFPSIVKYVSDLRSVDHAQYPNANLDIHLTTAQRAQKTAWAAHAESHLGDLVYHALYSTQENWASMTGPALASMFPVPQRYYVPLRIRDAHFPKLQAAGLWNVPPEEKPVEKPFSKEKSRVEKEDLKKNSTVTLAFERQKARSIISQESLSTMFISSQILEKARAEFDIYKSLLEGKTALFQQQPSSIDTLMAAHLLLLLNPPYPDPLFQNLILESYPSLVSYARNLKYLALGDGTPDIPITSTSHSVWALLPSWPKRPKTRKPESPEDVHFNHMRWGFFGLVAGSFAAYLAIVGSQYKIVWQTASKSSDATQGEEKQKTS